MKRLLLAILITLALGGQGWGATETFYACATGDGSAPKDGTCAHAWDLADLNGAGNYAALDAVDGKIGPNDDVILLDDGGDFGVLFIGVTHPDGLEGKPIRFIAGPGEKPKFNGGGATILAAARNKQDYYHWIGIEFYNVDGYAFDCDDPAYNLFERCDFHPGFESTAVRTGLYVHGASTGTIIRDCNFRDGYLGVRIAAGTAYISGSTASYCGDDGFRAEKGSTSVEWVDCVAYANGDDGLDTREGDQKTITRLKAYGNTVTGLKVGNDPVVAEAESGATIQYCDLFWNKNGLQLTGHDHVVVNCNIVHNWEKGVESNSIRGPYTFRNNLVALNGLLGGVIYSGLTSYSIDYNVWYNPDTKNTAFYGGVDYTVGEFADWQKAVKDDFNSVAVDPHFLNSGTSIYTLRYKIPGTKDRNNDGVDDTTPYYDMGGYLTPRQGNYPTVGAYDFRSLGRPGRNADGGGRKGRGGR